MTQALVSVQMPMVPLPFAARRWNAEFAKLTLRMQKQLDTSQIVLHNLVLRRISTKRVQLQEVKFESVMAITKSFSIGSQRLKPALNSSRATFIVVEKIHALSQHGLSLSARSMYSAMMRLQSSGSTT